jgi:hypothetical protein
MKSALSRRLPAVRIYGHQKESFRYQTEFAHATAVVADVSVQAYQETVHLGGRPQIQGGHEHPAGERNRRDLEKNGVNVEPVEISVVES